MVLLFLNMLGNAIFYSDQSDKIQSGIKSGFFSLSSVEVLNGLLINFLTFPFTFLIVFLFKYSKNKYLRENRIVEALNHSKSNDNEIQPEREDSQHYPNKRFTLPFFCKYVGWFLVIITVMICSILLWVYGVSFGNDKVYKWLTAFLLSFFTSFFIFEPLKVNIFY